MFYYLYIKFHNQFHLLNLFRYITFRTAYASLTALLLSLVVGPWLVRVLKEFQIGQYVREDGPKSHLSKAGTPTMGGVLINLCIFVPTLLWSDLRNVFVWLVLGVTAAFAGIGFWDDYQKVRAAEESGPDRADQVLASDSGQLRLWCCADLLLGAWFLLDHLDVPLLQALPARSFDHRFSFPSMDLPSRLFAFPALCSLRNLPIDLARELDAPAAPFPPPKKPPVRVTRDTRIRLLRL